MPLRFKDIEGDKVEFAYHEFEAENEKNKLCPYSAYYAVVSLNKLVLTSLKTRQPCYSNCTYIYKLAELCCRIEGMWKENQKGCMQCVYHIIRYLLSQGEPFLARKLCEYFFHYCRKGENLEWDETESLVLKNSIMFFNHYLYDTKKALNDDPDSNTNPYISWYQFILKLNGFNDFTCSSDLFRLCYILLRRSQSSSTAKIHANILNGLLKELTHHLKTMLQGGTSLSRMLKADIIAFSINILSDNLCYFEKNNSDLLPKISSSIRDFFHCLKDLVTYYDIQDVDADDMKLISLTFAMFLSESDDVMETTFEAFFSAISDNKSYCIEIFPFIYDTLSTLRDKIYKHLSVNPHRVVQLVKIIRSMYKKTKSQSKELSSKRGSELLHAFTGALYFLFSAKLDSESLKEIYKTVAFFFTEFTYLVSNLTKSLSVFECGVSYFINIIQSYKNVELYGEMATLSRNLLKYILTLNPDFIPYDKFKLKLDHLLNYFIISHGKINEINDALEALLALVGVHPQYTDLIFKCWAELKANLSEIQVKYKEITCHEVVTRSKKVIEEKWSPCSLEKINIGDCLLHEIKHYAKHRELQIRPVIAAYRVSANLVKDKFILAQILTATVDSVSSDEYISTLNNLHVSLENMLGSLSRMKDATTDKHKLCKINCFIGDILYQQIRCNIAQTRKKAEDELELLNVPIIDEEANNNITHAYSYLKFEDHKALVEKMTDVLKHWSEAAQLASHEDESIFTVRYIKGLAYLLRLYKFKALEIEAWKLMYLLSKTLLNSKYKILALGELMSLTTLIDQSWVKEVEDTLKSDDVPKKSYVTILYSINRARNFYFQGKYDEAYKQVDAMCENSFKNYLLEAQYNIIVFLIKLHKIENHERLDNSLLSLIKSFEKILYSVKMKTWRTFSEKCVVLYLLFDVSLVITKTYLDLRMIRHARCYSKKQLASAQRLALPLRVCEYLSVLSAADLLTGNSVDANEKLYGLDTILGLDSISLPNTDSEIYLCEKVTKKTDVNKPKFLTHGNNCACFFCSNMDLLAVFIDSFSLKILYTSFAGAEDLGRHLSTIGEEIIQFSKTKDDTFLLISLSTFTESIVRYYINLSYTHAHWGQLPLALTYNKHALEILELKANNRLLMKNVNSQLTDLNWMFYKPSSLKKFLPKLYVEDNLPLESAKTPEPEKKTLNILAGKLKRAVSPVSCKYQVSPRAGPARKFIFDDIEMGKYKQNDKENIGSPDLNFSSENSSSRSPLARVLPDSPKAPHRKFFLDVETSENTHTPKIYPDWALETPITAVKMNKPTKTGATTRGRKAQTEKKKKSFASDSFSTPFLTKAKPEIKIFCDDEIDALTKNAKTGGRKKGTTTTKKIAKKTTKKAVSGRKLKFDDDLSDEDNQMKKESHGLNGKPPSINQCLFSEKRKVEPSSLSRCLFNKNEEKPPSLSRRLFNKKEEKPPSLSCRLFDGENEEQSSSLSHELFDRENEEQPTSLSRRLFNKKEKEEPPSHSRPLFDGENEGQSSSLSHELFDRENEDLPPLSHRLFKEKKEENPPSFSCRLFDKNEKNPPSLSRRLFGEEKEEKLPSLSQHLFCEKKEESLSHIDSEGKKIERIQNPWLSDDSGIIEPSFTEYSDNPFCLTPLGGLEDSMKKLALSGKKLRPLSTKKMAKLNTVDQTPASSLITTRTSSRLNGGKVCK